MCVCVKYLLQAVGWNGNKEKQYVKLSEDKNETLRENIKNVEFPTQIAPDI